MDEKVREIKEYVRHLKVLVPSSLEVEYFDYLLSHISTLSDKIKELEAKTNFTYCAFCGATFPMDDSTEDVARHIKTCEKHPMRDLEAENKKLKERVKELTEAIEKHKYSKYGYVDDDGEHYFIVKDEFDAILYRHLKEEEGR